MLYESKGVGTREKFSSILNGNLKRKKEKEKKSFFLKERGRDKKKKFWCGYCNKAELKGRRSTLGLRDRRKEQRKKETNKQRKEERKKGKERERDTETD